MTPSGEQIRAARALLRLEQRQLAQAAGVSLETIKRLEAMKGPVSANSLTVERITAAIEAAGALFIPENTEGPGVRLRKNHAA